METSKEHMIEQNRKIVVLMFKSRCLICNKPYRDIHEIIPKSHRPKDWWQIDNMVPLCGSCHEWVTGAGTKNTIELLTFLRSNRINMLYGSENPPKLG